MNTKLIATLIFLTALSSYSQTSQSAATANENTSRAGLSDILQNKKFQENEKITDAKLKADGGSLSKYSLSATLSYYGPTLGDFSAADQPNPDGNGGNYETALGGSLGGRFRFDSRSSLTAGTGLKAIHPFHGLERFDVNNPYLSYNLSDRFGEVQIRNSAGVSVITVPSYTKVGETAGLNWDTSAVYNLGDTRFAVGLDTSVAYYFYYRGYEKTDIKTTTLYKVSAFPNIKYNFTDKFSVNTSVNFSAYNPRNRYNQSVLLNNSISERLGVGYAYTRDIYFAPYLNFYPSNLSDDGTTINFSTVFSVL